MPARPKWSGSPMPESCRTCGEPMAPAARITSHAASTRSAAPLWENSTPTARLPSNRTRRTSALVMNLQVGPLQRRAQIGARRTLPPAPAAGLLDPANVVSSAGRQMVHILMVFKADLYAGLDHLVTEERLVGGSRGQKRAAFAVKFIGSTLPIFRLLEKGQHIVPGPAAVAELRPVIEIFRLTADIDHPVDRAGAAQDPAAWVENGAPIGAGIGLCCEAPGQARVIHQFYVAGRNMDERVPVAPAGLEQHDLRAGVFAQPVGERAARRASADDHIIRLHGSLPSRQIIVTTETLRTRMTFRSFSVPSMPPW